MAPGRPVRRQEPTDRHSRATTDLRIRLDRPTYRWRRACCYLRTGQGLGPAGGSAWHEWLGRTEGAETLYFARRSWGDMPGTPEACLSDGTVLRRVLGGKDVPLGSVAWIAPGGSCRKGREVSSARHSRVFARR